MLICELHLRSAKEILLAALTDKLYFFLLFDFVFLSFFSGDGSSVAPSPSARRILICRVDGKAFDLSVTPPFEWIFIAE